MQILKVQAGEPKPNFKKIRVLGWRNLLASNGHIVIAPTHLWKQSNRRMPKRSHAVFLDDNVELDPFIFRCVL